MKLNPANITHTHTYTHTSLSSSFKGAKIELFQYTVFLCHFFVISFIKVKVKVEI